MPWHFELADGRTLEYPDSMPYEEALQRARRENNPARVNPDNGWRDAGDSLESGLYTLESGVGGILNMIEGAMPGGGMALRRAGGIRSIGDMIQDNANTNTNNALASMSPEMAARIAPHPDDGVLGTIGVTNDDSGVHFDPAKIIHGGIQSVPSLVATMGVGGGAGAASRLMGAGETTAARASQIGAASTEGALGAGGVDGAIDQSIRLYAHQDPEAFINSEVGRRALSQTDGDFARAVEVAAQNSKGVIPTTVGVVEGLVGYFGVNPFTRNASAAASHSLANSLLNPSTSGLARFLASVGIGGAQEAGEEAIQSGAEQLGTNMGVANVNPQQDLMAGVPEAAAQGAATAFPLGGAFEGYRAATERQPAGPTIEGRGRPRPGTTDTSGAEDADFYDSRMLPPPEGEAPAPTEPPAPGPSGGSSNAEATARAEEYARNAEEDPAAPIEPGDDATRAETIRDMASSLGRAVPEVPEAPAGATRTAEPVPLYGLGERFGEDEDPLAHQIYKSAVGNGLSPSETETFQAYSELADGLYPDPSSHGQTPAGFGLRIVDRLPNGQVSTHVVATPAASLEEAAALARAHNGSQVAPETAAPAPDSAMPQRSASAPAPTETIAEPAPAFVPDVAPIRPRSKRPTTPRQFVDGLLTGQLRGASISDGQFEVLMGTEGHAAETGTDTARYAQLAKSGDVEITSSPATKNSPQGTLNIRVTPDAKPENVKKAIAVYQRAVKDGITPSVGLHTADKPHGVLIYDHGEALKTLREIAQRNPSSKATAQEDVPAAEQNTEINHPSPGSVPDNGEIPLAVPGKVIPNVPSNIGNIYRETGHEGLSRSLGKANVMQIRSAAKRFGIKLQPKSTRESLINQLADHFERNSRFNPKTGVRLRPGRGIPERGAEPAVRQEVPVEKAPSQVREEPTPAQDDISFEEELPLQKPFYTRVAEERAAEKARAETRRRIEDKRVARQATPAEPARGQRTLPELKDELRRLNKLEDDDYVSAARATSFSKEEIATVEGAIQAGDKEAWNLRDVLSDVKRKPKASVNQERAATQEKIETKKATTAERKKAREMTDSYLASSIAKGQPDVETAVKAARDYVIMQRGRGKAAEASWSMAREENLVAKVERYFEQGGMESRTAPRDLTYYKRMLANMDIDEIIDTAKSMGYANAEMLRDDPGLVTTLAADMAKRLSSEARQSFTPPRKGKGADAPLDSKWVSEMQDALRAAAECAAASMGAAAAATSAAASEAIIGTGLGAVAAAPIAIAGSALYHSMPHPEHEGAVPFSSVRLDGDGFVDPASVADVPHRRTHGHAPVDQVPFDGYRNNPTTGHPLFAPPESAPQEPVDNSELGDRLINALNLPPRRRGPPE